MKKIKRLILVRHAKADRSIDFINDIERPLTMQGYSDAIKVSHELRQLKIVPDQIISSTAIRAYTTAMIVANDINFPLSRIELNHSLYLAGTENYISIIRTAGKHTDTLMLAGHNPDMEDLVSSISGKAESFPTMGICVVTIKSKSWKKFKPESCKIEKVIKPKSLKSL